MFVEANLGLLSVKSELLMKRRFFSQSTTGHKPLTSHSLMNLTKFNSSKGINRLDVVLKGTWSSSLTPFSSCKKGKRAVGRRILEIIPHFSATQVEILEDTIKHFQGVGGKLNSISEASSTRLLKSLFTPYGLKSIWEKVDQFTSIDSL